jgi:DNA-binding transcriptional ArsR family regulator
MKPAIDVLRGTERLRGGLTPLRRTLLEALREPASAAGLAARLGESRQRIAYHLRELEKGGLVELVEERQRRGCVERVVRLSARAVLAEPVVVGDLAAVTQDRFATDTLLAAAARTVSTVAEMRERAEAQGRRLATFAIEADVAFEHPADIERFANDLAGAVAVLAAKYDTGAARRRYRVVIGGHPAPRPREEP